MPVILKNKRQWLLTLLGFSLMFGVCLDAGAQKKVKKKQAPKTDNAEASAEPDKVLFDRASNDIKHGRYTEGRLAYQTLINTYPDSEYLAKAKLGLADSYFKEGGTTNLTQAVSEYKDFGTFFPFLDEAAYAQMQVGMCHYKMMEKSDRDTAHAQQAEDEFQAMLLKYPQSKYAPEAEQHLREVQEVLADGEFKIARFYYTKQDFRASAARLLEVTDRYPLYSQSDDALWMLGSVYMWAKMKTPGANEDLRNYWSDQAAKCYDRILTNYPLSNHARDAKSRLTAMGKPVPSADPDALVRLRKDQLYAKEHHKTLVLKAPLGMIKGSPDLSMAAHTGAPNLNPPNDAISASDVLKPGATGPTFGVAASATGTADTGASSAPTTQVDVAPGPSMGSGFGSGTNVGVQIIEAPTTSNPPASGSSAQPSEPAPATIPAPAAQPPAGSSVGGGSSTPANGPADAAAQPAAAQTGTGDAAAQSAPQSSGTAPAAASGQAGTQPSNSTNDSNQESTSKKKKGIKKLIPW